MTAASAAIQTTVDLAPAVGAPGQQFDSSPCEIISRIATEAIPFGTLVKFTGDACELPDSSGEITGNRWGVALKDPTKATTVAYAVGDVVRILTKGRVYVLAEEAIVDTDAVFARHTTGTGTQKGAFRNDADTATAATPTGCAWFKGSTTMPVLEVNTP